MDRAGELEALRRRLYRPGASDADRLRYAALVPPAPQPVPEAPRPRPRRAPLAIAVLAVVVVVASGSAIAASRPTASDPIARPAATVVPAASPAPVVLKVRRAGGAAETVHGTGSATVALDVSAVSMSGGSLDVLLSAKDERPAGWQALRLRTRRDWSSYPQLVRSSPARDRFAATRSDVLDYTGDPPRWIRVQAAADASWRLTVTLHG